MKVLFAITKGEVGGAQEHVRILGEGLVARGHAVVVLAKSPSYLSDALGRAGATVREWPDIVRNPHPLRDARARRQLGQAVAEVRPDVLALHSSKAGMLGRGALRPPRGVTIFTCHHLPYGPRRQWSHRLVGRPLDQLMLPRLDGIISVGARDIPTLRRLAPRVPVRLVRNAVPSAGPPVGAEPNETALWVARLQRPKDPLLAVQAWERVVDELPGARLLLCGTGPLEDAVRSRVARSAARDRIEVLGLVPDLRPHQARASVFLLTTDVEGGITMATLEAMAQGLVPVVSDAGDAWLLEVARCGVSVAPRSARAAADAVVELLRHPERIAQMRQRALRYAREDWTTDDFVDATVDFYEEVVSGMAARRPS